MSIGQGAQLGEYRLEEELSRGVLWLMHKAHHLTTGQTVAIKVLKSTFAGDPSAVKRFHREIETSAKLQHPNIVTVQGSGEHQGVHYLVAEYIDGLDLGTVLEQRGPFPVEESLDLILTVSRAMEFAHGVGVIHRNLKPANILFDEAGELRILDFGMARINDELQPQEALTQDGQMMGTVDYMSPEQARDPRSVDARSDIYSVGCIWFRMLTGRPPFEGAGMMQKLRAHMTEPVPSLREHCPDAPVEMEQVFQRMLAKAPEERFNSMSELINALEACRAPLLAELAKQRRQEQNEEQFSKSALRLAILTALVVSIGLFAMLVDNLFLKGLVLLPLALIGIGFWRGWFWVASTGKGAQVSLSVNMDKLKRDSQTVQGAASSARQRVSSAKKAAAPKENPQPERSLPEELSIGAKRTGELPPLKIDGLEEPESPAPPPEAPAVQPPAMAAEPATETPRDAPAGPIQLPALKLPDEP